MLTPTNVFAAPRNRLAPALAIVAASVFAIPGTSVASPARSVVALKTVQVGAPGNPSVGIVPFTDAIYASCADAPQAKPACQQVGGVKYRYGIGQLEVTVRQWVAFLNTVDPRGRNKHHHIVGIREQRYKLARYYDADGNVPDQWEMYDLKTDPLERINLAYKLHRRTPKIKRQYRRLRRKLARVEQTRLQPLS